MNKSQLKILVLFVFVLPSLGCITQDDNAAVDRPAPDAASTDSQSPHYVLTKAGGKRRGVILLFHQAGSNLHEYDPIAPMFNKIGYDTIAVDQRSGGTMWGHDNATAKKYEKEQGYSETYPDMEAALKIAEGSGYDRIVVVGSSYSASLALKLASENSTVSAVIAFSPGEYLEVEGEVAKWNSLVTVPTMFVATKDEVTKGVFKIYDEAPRVQSRSQDLLFALETGVHGASTLRKDKNPKSNFQYWAAVEMFLDSHFSD